MTYAALLGSLPAALISAFIGWLVWGRVNVVRGVARSAALMYRMPPVAGLVARVVTGGSYTGIGLAGAGLGADVDGLSSSGRYKRKSPRRGLGA